MFEFDPEKSAANLAKHGIDFETAQDLWRDLNRLTIPARGDGEERWAVIGLIEGKIWTAIITFRDGLIRIISVRRSREIEAERYGNENDFSG